MQHIIIDALQETAFIVAQARHLRDIGYKGLSHAAYRSARTRLRELARREGPAPCYCGECKGPGAIFGGRA